jgi:superfamily II DNA or RNA helicase
MKKCKITILDNANCVISNLCKSDHTYLYEEYSEFAPGYRFAPKFKLGSWDGKLRYFHKTGKTFVNLLPDIVPRLIGLKYKIEVNDKRVINITKTIPHIDEHFFGDIINPETGEYWKVREYQIEMINKLIDSGGGIGIAGTGAGKTGCVAALVLSYERSNNLRSIIIVPDKNLTLQTYADFEFFGLDVGEYSGTIKDLSHQHIISTWQALQHNPMVLRDFGVVVVDECHGAKGAVITKLLNEYGTQIPFRFGVTGTLPKEPADKMAVKIVLGDVVYEIPAHVLIQKGFLAKLHIDIMQLEVDLKDVYQEYCDDAVNSLEKPVTYIRFKDRYFPDWPSEKSYFQSEPERLQWMADYIQLKSEHGNVLCLTVGVPFGKRLAKLIPNAIYLYGNDSVETRLEVFNLFKTHNNLIILANAKIASTGLNVKRIFNLMLIDIGKSFITTIQGIGRGLRKAHDKDNVHVTDICCDLFHSKRHLRDRIIYYNEAKYPCVKHTVDYR